MMKINHNEKESHGLSQYKYHFPTLDFKFQNTGTATAVLKQFEIDILFSEMNKTPALNFEVNAENGTLLITVTNNGWGTAHDCSIYIDEPILNRLFEDSLRQFTGTIQSGESKRVLSLPIDRADSVQLKSMKQRFVDLGIVYPKKFRLPGIHLGPMRLLWETKDEMGIHTKGEEEIRVGASTSTWVVLTPKGFFKFSGQSGGASRMLSFTTYISMIDASKAPHKQTYPLSRKISPGDAERFHIMVGSRISCHLRLRFRFFIDQATIIESELFTLDIWNPRNSRWNDKYVDGQEAIREDMLKFYPDYPFSRIQKDTT